MAAGEITGRTEAGLEEMREQFHEEPLHTDHDIPFDVAYCLIAIGKQPDDYDGPQRYCANRASKRTEEEWQERDFEGEYQDFDTRAYCPRCSFHGRNAPGNPDKLESYTANLKHGIYAEDEHLRMDFTDAEEKLYDGIVEQWPEIYDWPDEGEDPARYMMLRKVATNFVRTERAEDYLDDEGEVRMRSEYDQDGIEIGEYAEENPLAGEYRLLVREIQNMLKELGLTPKERRAQGARETGANALEAIGEVAGEAIMNSDKDYNPDEFGREEGGAGDSDNGPGT